jgi:rhodanese-related sulfurtransferase
MVRCVPQGVVMPNPLMGPVLSDVPVRAIEREELRQRLARGDGLKLVMCLNEWAFVSKRIPGSIHFNTAAEMLDGLHQDDEIVVYCSNPECLASLAAYHRLADHGYTRVRRYAGGLVDWENAGLPLEGRRVQPCQS